MFNCMEMDFSQGCVVVKLLRVLEPLRQSRDGTVLYQQIEQMLAEIVDEHARYEQAYSSITQALLGAYTQHIAEDSPLKFQIRMLQSRLQSPLSAGDMKLLDNFTREYSIEVSHLQSFDQRLLEQSLQPLIQAFGITQDVMPEKVSENIQQESPIVTEDRLDDSYAPSRVAESNNEIVAPNTRTTTESYLQSADNQISSAYRSHLDARRKDIQKLQTGLSEHVLSAISQHEEFGVLLDVVMESLKQVESPSELESLRWSMQQEIGKLVSGSHKLVEWLNDTHQFLQMVEDDSRQLSHELERVHLLSMTDELTNKPNRRAFLRCLEDEMARAERYGHPLSVAMIDIDHFKQVNDRYGHAAGDDVLQVYSNEVLSIFRHHDMVARYGGEEFAVLLPDTDIEGALKALKKVKRRVEATRWRNGDDMLDLPSFSAGCALYHKGEKLIDLVERVDQSLYRAKNMGRNRIEIDASSTAEKDHVGIR
ncbi:MAG: GGDEF domain-containing protein [Gammaproteobacteria bacterium]|nr:GGDEF domain-containing protein [Gammaproteobacteria bacterium]